MNQNMSAEDALALKVVAARKEYNHAHSERLEASSELARCEREETNALNHFNEAKAEFDKMIGAGL